LVAGGKVLSSNWTPPVLKGVVSEGSASYRAGLVIKDEVNIDNLCSCRASRGSGMICAHSVALGLHHLQREKKSSPGLATTAPAGAGALRTKEPRPGPRLRRAGSGEAGEPLEISVLLPPTLAASIERGKVMAGDLTNVVALDKALMVQSVNGPKVTTILGSSLTNGPTATRCAWLTNGAILSGFTIKNGATRTTGDGTTLQNGGGIWCASSNVIIANCMIISNTCASLGGGAYQGSLRNCAVLGNRRGVDSVVLLNCTVVSNSVAGVSGGPFTNSIIYFNVNNFSGPGIALNYCCCTPPGFLPGNISSDPQLSSDGFHLANTSPCRAAGTNVVVGTDIDGDVWANPPPMGCDQWTPTPLIYQQPRVAITSDPSAVLLPNGAARLTAAEVTNIIVAAANRARTTRAGIRLPRGQVAQVFISVVNNPNADGSAPVILGSFCTSPDTTRFSWDVSVQKARTAVFFSASNRAFSARTVGFLAQSLYPPGIGGTQPGLFFGLQERFSIITPTSIVATNSVNGAVFTTSSNVNPNLPNGITIFPGAFPLYRNGALIGAVGVSGDGIDQDDIISAMGASLFPAAEPIRADRTQYRGARLPYAKFPRNPAL